MADRERALAAVCDTFVAGDAALPSASALGTHRLLRSEVEALERPALVAELDQFLDTIESPVANLGLIGRAVRFSALGQAEREDYLKRWAGSPIPLKRKAFQVLKRLSLLYTYGLDGSPYAERAGYARQTLDTPAPAAALRITTPRDGETIDGDACVVGSGAGGAVVAAALAAAGRHVVVLERGMLRTEMQFDARELPAYASLFLDRGIASTEDRAIAVLAGSAVGGGTVVNWNTSLRLSPAVRDEWRAAGVDDLDRHYDAVESRLDVDADESERNGPNLMLERGLRRLGWSCATIRRNVKGCGDCGACTLGCRRGAKQSTLRTYLVDACAAGAEIVPETEARRIEVQSGRAAAVVARVAGGGQLRIRAPLVALAGGAILSPALLLRSGIAPAQAGRHLHLHPVAVTNGDYPEDLGGHWSGVPQSVLSEEFADLEAGYGFRLEIPAAYPGILAASTPWWGSADHLERAARFRHLAAVIAIVRDREEGRVTVDAAGEARTHYECGPLERRLLTIAMQRCAELHRAAGARRIATLHTPPLELGADEDFDTFHAAIGRRGVLPNRVTLFSAHQMSTCRIGGSPRDAVADPDGQVWGLRGLYVTDASAFPSASGVNPMLTVMALARRTAERMR